MEKCLLCQSDFAYVGFTDSKCVNTGCTRFDLDYALEVEAGLLIEDEHVVDMGSLRDFIQKTLGS